MPYSYNLMNDETSSAEAAQRVVGLFRHTQTTLRYRRLRWDIHPVVQYGDKEETKPVYYLWRLE
jgi:hypothetical protein